MVTDTASSVRRDGSGIREEIPDRSGSDISLALSPGAGLGLSPCLLQLPRSTQEPKKASCLRSQKRCVENIRLAEKVRGDRVAVPGGSNHADQTRPDQTTVRPTSLLNFKLSDNLCHVLPTHRPKWSNMVARESP